MLVLKNHVRANAAKLLVSHERTSMLNTIILSLCAASMPQYQGDYQTQNSKSPNYDS
jgi:hypothetical protein